MKDIIRTLRKNKGISQTELADALHVTQVSVSQWETGRSNPDINLLPQIAEFLGVSTDYLLGKNTPSNIEHFTREPVKVETFTRTPAKVESFPRTENIESTQKEKAPISDEDLKFALFGRTDIDDKALNAVKKFARYVDDEEDE